MLKIKRNILKNLNREIDLKKISINIKKKSVENRKRNILFSINLNTENFYDKNTFKKTCEDKLINKRSFSKPDNIIYKKRNINKKNKSNSSNKITISSKNEKLPIDSNEYNIKETKIKSNNNENQKHLIKENNSRNKKQINLKNNEKINKKPFKERVTRNKNRNLFNSKTTRHFATNNTYSLISNNQKKSKFMNINKNNKDKENLSINIKNSMLSELSDVGSINKKNFTKNSYNSSISKCTYYTLTRNDNNSLLEVIEKTNNPNTIIHDKESLPIYNWLKEIDLLIYLSHFLYVIYRIRNI